MMRGSRLLAVVGAVLASLLIATPAQGASDPLFILPLPSNPPPPPLPPLCGAAVDSFGSLYTSDYYNHRVGNLDLQPPGPQVEVLGQLGNVDPLYGPCGLALDSTNRIFVNVYHRNITRFNASPNFGTGTVFPLPAQETALHLPTGVAINTLTNRLYVNHRSYVGVYDLDGNPIEEGGEPLRIGQGSLGDGYGLAVSLFGETLGRLYVPDAATNTVKVFNSTGAVDDPIAEIKDPFGKPFTSLRDSAIAIDKVTGEVYFADNLQPNNTERPQASIYVYSPQNTYKGRLKYNVIDALPPGLAVDNSLASSQGRVYVTSGNTSPASIYVYGPGAATLATPLPPIGSGLQPPGSVSGAGSGAESQGTQATTERQRQSQSPASASASVVTQKGNLRVSVDGRLSPKKLPREGTAPISVSVGWQIATTDGAPPPKLRGLRIEINRHGHFDRTGLPLCPLAKIQPATTQRALSNCRSALVGRGSFSAQIALKGQEGEAYDANGQLLVFNGEAKGKPVLFGQIYSPRPFATSFVITFEVKSIAKGDYGTVLSAKLPPALRSWGNLTGIEMKLERRYSFKGKKRSYVSAGCPAPKGTGLASFNLARTEFSFAGGTALDTTVVGDCRVG